jgi:hypothetical protein
MVQRGLAFGAGVAPPLRQVGNGTPVTPGVLPQSDGKPLPTTAPVSLIVSENASKLFMDLKPLFAKFKDLHPEDGLRYSVLGNTNSGLVKAALSEAELTLTFAHGKWGSATLTVGATDADGVCARVTLAITVCPILYTSPPLQPVQTLPSIAGSGAGISGGSGSGTGMPAGPGSASMTASGGGATSGPSEVGYGGPVGSGSGSGISVGSANAFG